MAVTSIWRVNGWLGKVVVYVENPDKTTNPEFYENRDMTERECQGLDDVISYAVNSRKTEQHKEDSDVLERFVSGVNCHPATARAEMLSVKKRFGKEDGTIAYHGYQSFAPGEATPEMAHKIGVELAQRLWGDRYQVVVATHLDKANHLHSHFVLNTVSFVDGIKYHRTAKDYHEMQAASDALCREYGLSVIENPQPRKSKHYGEWRAEQEQRPTWRGIVRSDVDAVIRQSMTERQFFDNLHRKGYEVKVGKDISVRSPGKERFVRLARNFGEDYTMEGIRRRILEQSRAVRPMPEPAPKRKHYRVSGNWQSHKKVTGFRALYFHYCYLLGVLPRQKTQNRKRLHFLLREDLIKLDAITQEARLLAVHRIDTAEQLSSYQSELESRITDMTSQRKQLYRKQRTVAVKSDEAASTEVSTAISALSKELSQLRREVKLCSDIAVRSGILPERIQEIQKSQRKEQNEHMWLRHIYHPNDYLSLFEFTYLKVAEIVQFTESTNDGVTFNHVEVLYGIDKTIGADLLNTLGLHNGAERYTNADQLDNTKYFYQSDVLIDALALGLQTNSTTVKNALERYIAANGGTAMPLTDSYGKSQANDLDLGLYLVIETKVPEMVTSTCNPFFVSIPMTSVNGTNATDGGTRWIYDVTIYPKNLCGIPSLEKTLRESVDDTGKHEGTTDDIEDGYAHTGTASDGDVIDYQLISTLPSITSESTYLTEYTFVDTLSAGLSYNKKDVIVEFFTDAACTDLLDSWDESDGMFAVTYSTTNANESVMTIKMTAQGLKEINTNKRVYTGASMVNSGYSDCTIRITYKATMHSDESVVYGDSGNPNEVVLLWKRSSQDYYDTLVDDAHVYTYAMELTKLFSDGNGNFENVEFIMQNDSDGYFVKAELNEEEGIYYVVDHVENEADATHFVPVIPQAVNPRQLVEYKVIVKGLEDDNYTVTEVRTDDGYTLLKDDIKIVISQVETTELCDIYASDVLGLVQNDPRYATIINDTGDLKNMPQKHLEHHLLTASATVDGNDVNMLEDDGSINAVVPLKVVNTRGFDLPQTGDHGTWMFSVIGIMLMAGAAVVIIMTSRKKRTADQ